MPPNTTSSTLTSTALHDQVAEVTPTKAIIKKEGRWNKIKAAIKWRNFIVLTIIHNVALYSFIMFPYREQLFLLAWVFIVAEFSWLGMSAGAHRLWSHRAFKATVPLRIFFAISFYTTGMGSIYEWVRDHRAHHKYTDTDADPVDSRRSFWFNHVGWLMMKKKRIVRERENEIDMTDILQDPVVQFFDRNHYVFTPLLTYVVPVVIPVYFFNQDLKWTILSQAFMRYIYVMQSLWSLNSFAHKFGTRPYDKSITQTDNLFLSVFVGMEAWLNYHHTFPWDYRLSEKKKILFNTTTLWIELFEKVGLASDLKWASLDHVRKVVEAKGDGTHSIYGNKQHIQKK